MESEIIVMPKISIIVPVYNRPDEMRELLISLSKNNNTDKVELIVVEDGSAMPCRDEVLVFSDILSIKYIAVENGGPAKARNIGAKEAKGQYLLFLDSDVVLPNKYLDSVLTQIERTQADAFGGPDSASDDFTDIQKAINYAMTSPLTTGGIRGGNNSMEKFKPRSFNMGCKKVVFDRLGGFASELRFGEDIDLSLRLIENNYNVLLFKDSFVYHKRRLDFWKFFKQVYNSGMARVILESRHKGSTKIVHLLPMFFTVAVFISLLSVVIPFYLIIFLHSLVMEKNSLLVSLLAPVASFVQLFGYGLGYIVGLINKYLLAKGQFSAFEKTFYD